MRRAFSGSVLRTAFAVSCALAAVSTDAIALERVANDAPLLAALRADRDLRACACIIAAGWLNLSYPHVTVDAAQWKRRGRAERRRLSARALEVAEKTYLAEFASEDQYAQITIVDARGRVLATYEPR